MVKEKVTKEIAIMDAIVNHPYHGIGSSKIRRRHIKEKYNMDVTDKDIEQVKQNYKNWVNKNIPVGKRNWKTMPKKYYKALVKEQNRKQGINSPVDDFVKDVNNFAKEGVDKLLGAPGKIAETLTGVPTELREKLEKENKAYEAKKKEFFKAGGGKVLSSLSEEQKKLLERMSIQKREEYLTKINPTVGKIFGELTVLSDRKHAVEEEIAKKKGEFRHKFTDGLVKKGVDALYGRNAKPVVRKDSEKGNNAKRKISTSKKVPQSTVNKANNPTMPREVEEQLRKLENDYKLVTLGDSKGNRIYCFEKDGEHAAVMTQMKDQKPSEYMEVKSDAMKGLVHQGVEEYGKKHADFTDVIGKINNQARKDAANGVEHIGLRELGAQLNTISAPEPPKEVKLKITPTVTLVPHIKKSGKPSKRKSDIQLMDADGKIFILTEKMVKEAAGKRSGATFEQIQATWDNYLNAAKEGKLQPETVASFFKEAEPNIPQSQLTAVQIAQMKGGNSNG